MATLVQGTPSDREFYQHVKARADLVNAVPREPFLREDVSDGLADKLNELRSQGIIDRVGTEERKAANERSTYDLAEFALDDRAREIADDVVSNRDAICPCGHTGLSNCGDHYECTYALCERAFAREDLEADHA